MSRRRLLIRFLLTIGATLAGSRLPAQMTFTPVTLPHPEIQDSSVRFGQIIVVLPDSNGDGVPEIGMGVPFLDEGAKTIFGVPLNVGRAFLYDGATMTVLRKFDDPDFQVPDEAKKFGGKLGPMASVGDVDGDGKDDLLIGLPFKEAEVGGFEEDGVGEAFVFSGRDGTLIRRIEDEEGEEFAQFSWAIAAAGDTDLDGIPDFLLSAPFKPEEEEQEEELAAVGFVYLVSGRDGSVLRKFEETELQAESEFGISIVVADADGDGVRDLVVGAPGHGTVTAFRISDGSVLRTFEDPEPQANARFGALVDGGRDVSGDGVPDVLVSSPFHDGSGNAAEGRIHVFSGADGSLVRTIAHPDPQARARFGIAAALVPDMNGDGKAEILAGAPDQDVGGVVNAGEAFVLSGADGSVLATLLSPEPQEMAGFGATVAGADLNRDGVVDPLVAAPLQDVLHPVELDLHHDQGMVVRFDSANRAPVADPQSVTTAEDSAASVTLTGSDADHDVLTFTVVLVPQNGALSGAPPNLTYTPNANFHGADSFTFHVGDGKVTSADATVSLTVTSVNDSPVANAGADQTADEGATVVLDGTGSGDVDGDTLSVSWKQIAGPRVRLRSKRTLTPSFVAPAVTADTVLTFRLSVSDGSVVVSDTVDVTVRNVE